MLDEMSTECLRKEAVVAIPLPLIVESNQKQIGALDMCQHDVPVGTLGDGIAKRPTEVCEHACLQ